MRGLAGDWRDDDEGGAHPAERRVLAVHARAGLYLQVHKYSLMVDGSRKSVAKLCATGLNAAEALLWEQSPPVTRSHSACHPHLCFAFAVAQM